MIEARQGVFKAVPLAITDPAKLAYMLDRLVEHESEWSDLHQDMTVRRHVARTMLGEALTEGSNVTVLEVWHVEQTPELVGLLGFTNILPGVDAHFHPTFFDGKMRNAFGKRELLLRALDWAFQTWNLHRVSAEVPGYSQALIKFLRRKLGFRFEAENRTIKQQWVVPHGLLKTTKSYDVTPRWQEAELGSRRYQMVPKHGRWFDLILLSITREEFAAFIREGLCPTSSTDPLPSKPSPAISEDSAKKS